MFVISNIFFHNFLNFLNKIVIGGSTGSHSDRLHDGTPHAEQNSLGPETLSQIFFLEKEVLARFPS